jgi:4-amino-4-deoxy-L-arabinose transferase-like glycosyltransferase
VTGPAAGVPERAARASANTSVTRGAVGGIVILLALGLALRVIIAYLLPGSGFGVDLNAFRFWAADLAQHGPFGFYDRGFFADYTPGYLYLLWLVGLVGSAVGGIGDLIKVPAIVCDLVVGYLIYSMVLELGGSTRRALIGAGLFLFIPITWFDSTVWGQVDSVGTVFLLLGLRSLWRDQPEWAALWATVAAVTKPQLGILLPIIAAVLIRRYLLDRWGPWARSDDEDTGGTADADPDDGGIASRLRRRDPIRLVTSAVVAIATATALSAPFGLSIVGLFGQVARAAGGYPYLAVNAYNPWALLSVSGNGIAANGTWVGDIALKAGDVALSFGPVPAVVVGTALLLVAIGAICVAVARRPDRVAILVAVAVMAIAFFVVPTRVHERYLYPFIAVGAILFAVSWRWRIPYLAIGAANFLNLYVVLTTLYPNNPQIQDWLGLGPAIRSSLGVTLIAVTHLAVFVWAFAQLRGSALDRLAADVATSAEPERLVSFGGAVPAPRAALPPASAAAAVPAGGVGGIGAAPPAGGAAVATGGPGVAPPTGFWRRPDADDPGALAAIRRRLLVRPARMDRTAGLAGESGGRFDRLDLWVLVVLAVVVFFARMYRLELPYQMHFDEVYHARTATEFLQDWRYGEPHAIYEYTHPHLAKYAMAGGIVAFGDDKVTATSQLAAPARSSIVEPRWDDPRLPVARAGDRLYVATGSELRVYDLQDRRLIDTLPLPGARSLALDTSGHRLWVGTESGAIDVVDTTTFDDMRIGAPPPGPDALAPFAVLAAPATSLFGTSDGLYLLAAEGPATLVSLDAGSGTQLGRSTLPSVAGMAEAGTADTLVGHPAQVPDARAAAALLAQVLGGDAATYETKLTSSADQVVIAPAPAKDARDQIDAAIGDGRLAGLEFVSLPRVAVATATGVSLVSPADASVVQTVTLDGGATGLAAAPGLDTPQVYVAGGRTVTLITLPKVGDTTGAATIQAQIKMPGEVRDVLWDPSSLMVHVLGRTPDGSSPTVYVIEPHGNAVYADARLPFEPATWVMDAAPRYPAADRQEILAFAPDGTTAAVDVGSHAFAWRVPGVVAGTLTALLVYLLARLLFRRRSVAVLAGLFTLIDGMLFVQSRIGMNDVYVGLFIVAGYLLFAGLWVGRWRARWAFWVLMPAIGVLLGLALASKWVALYAIGGLGVLVLARSALGRIVLIAGLIGATAVLGYIGLSVPVGAVNGGNLTFMLLMVVVTLVAVAVSVLRPVAWSLDEVRFAIGAPVVLGIGILAVALPLGLVGPQSCDAASGACRNSPLLEVAFGLVALGAVAAGAFWLAARLGFGPLARPRPADDTARLLRSDPPPVGWLRPGWAYGLPVAWMVVSLVAIPLVVYVVSYLPWVALGNRLTDNWPPGNTGQTLADLTAAMYRYHNDLRAAHAASSPWWAWPFDLKPVWFYQGSFAAGTAGAIYDAGNIALWWLGVPAMAFCSWQAYRRRSLALALITIAYFCQWLPWARIDRATFQYHYYTAVPFLLVALAYFLAELWHGPSARTWFLARGAAAFAVLAPALLWLFRSPLCTFVRVTVADPGSQACIATPPGQIVLTARSAGLLLVMGIAIVAIVWQLLRLDRRRVDRAGGSRGLATLIATALLAAIAIILVGALLGESVLFSMSGFAPEIVALGLLVPLGLVAWFILTARDARRFVAGFIYVAVMWAVIWYPNISGLAMPAAFYNAYQGFLPTYLYPFQFPVNLDPAMPLPKLLSGDMLVLVAALVVTAVVVAYSAWTWRVSTAEAEAGSGAEDVATAPPGGARA